MYDCCGYSIVQIMGQTSYRVVKVPLENNDEYTVRFHISNGKCTHLNTIVVVRSPPKSPSALANFYKDLAYCHAVVTSVNI